ncbi:hypothetical protein AB6811_12095 [Tenuifilum sp. 4138str]
MIFTFFLVLIQERTKENQGLKARPEGYPVGGTATRYYSHACGVTHVVSLTKPTATFHPRPIAGSGFYDSACFFRSIPSQEKGLG